MLSHAGRKGAGREARERGEEIGIPDRTRLGVGQEMRKAPDVCAPMEDASCGGGLRRIRSAMSGGERLAEHDWLCFQFALFEAFAQDGLRAGMAFAAAGAYAELFAQLRHRGQALVDGLLDLSFRNIVANANDHSYTLWLSSSCVADEAVKPVTTSVLPGHIDAVSICLVARYQAEKAVLALRRRCHRALDHQCPLL